MPLSARPVYKWALDAVIDAGFATVIVVTGAAKIFLQHSLIEVHNPAWERGQGGSLRLGIERAQALGMSSVVVGLGDQPFLTAEAWRRVADTDSPIAIATYDGRRGHPVRLHRSVWPLMDGEGDEGARSLIQRAPNLVVEVACDGSPADIDTVEDLQQWNSSTNSSSTDPSTRRGQF